MILFYITESVNCLKCSVNEKLINLLTHRLIRYTIFNVVLALFLSSHPKRTLLAEHRSYIDGRIILNMSCSSTSSSIAQGLTGTQLSIEIHKNRTICDYLCDMAS